MKAYNLLFLLMFVATGLVILATTLEPQEYPIHRAAASDEINTQNRNSKKIAVSGDKLITEKTDETNYNYYGTYNYYPTESPKWAIIASAVATVAIALFALGQLFFLCKTMRATQDAANAATDSSRIAREALEITQRAAIKIENINVGKEGVSGKPIVGYHLHNVGHLPATGVVEELFAREGFGLGFEWPDRPHPRPSREYHRTVIEPGRSVRCTHYLIDPDNEGRESCVRPDHWEQMLKGNLQIQIGICLVYWDGFHHERISETWISRDVKHGTWQIEIMRQD